jgi:hypothetical protein
MTFGESFLVFAPKITCVLLSGLHLLTFECLLIFAGIICLLAKQIAFVCICLSISLLLFAFYFACLCICFFAFTCLLADLFPFALLHLLASLFVWLHKLMLMPFACFVICVVT